MIIASQQCDLGLHFMTFWHANFTVATTLDGWQHATVHANVVSQCRRTMRQHHANYTLGRTIIVIYYNLPSSGIV